MTKKCLARVEELLSKSSIRSVRKDEIINQIKIAQAEQKISSIDEINVDKISQEVSEQIKLQKKINKRNAIENEIKGRKYEMTPIPPQASPHSKAQTPTTTPRPWDPFKKTRADLQ